MDKEQQTTDSSPLRSDLNTLQPMHFRLINNTDIFLRSRITDMIPRQRAPGDGRIPSTGESAREAACDIIS